MNTKPSDWDTVEPCVGGGIDPGCELGHTRMEDHHLGMVCARCSHHTGNYTQGHYWGLCKVYQAQGKTWNECVRELHFCCPDDCELEA